MREKYLVKNWAVKISLPVILLLLTSVCAITASAEETGSPPVADAGGPYFGLEGEEITLDASGSSDPDGDALYYRWDFGDGWTNPSSNPITTFLWTDDFDGTIILEVTDFDYVVNDTAEVTISNVAPEVYFDAPLYIGTYLDDEFLLTASFWDPDPRSFSSDTHIAVFDWGDEAIDTYDVIDGELSITGSHVYTNVGLFTVNVSIIDDDGGVGYAVIYVAVIGVDIGEDITLNEGETFSRQGVFLLPESEVVSGFVNFGDGSEDTVLVINEDNSFDLSHIYQDNGIFTANVWLLDSDGYIVGGDNIIATLNNVAPDIISLTGLPTDPVSVDTAINLNADFTDPGLLDTHIASIDWGDGTVDQGTINDNTITCSHSYIESGVFPVIVTVEDDDGGNDTEIFEYIVVYDPDGGFVTGGGWINSPAGAYIPDETLTGKANFGFVSKYKKGQSTPIGNTEFQFKAGDLNFHSSEYDWLVIAGSKAMYKGTGTINNQGNYGFMLSAIDGKLKGDGIDRFRIKIWDKDTDELIYDNNLNNDENDDPTTELAGGKIVIHKK